MFVIFQEHQFLVPIMQGHKHGKSQEQMSIPVTVLIKDTEATSGHGVAGSLR